MKDLKSSFRNSIKGQDKILIVDNDIKCQDETPKLRIGKKQSSKINKKPFPIYLDDDRSSKLDKVCKKTGYSKNELVIMLIDFGLENLDIDV